MRVNSSADAPNGKTLESIIAFVGLFSNDVSGILNGEITFQENFRCQLKEVTFSLANSQHTIEHTLKKVPSGYFVVKATAATTVYDGTTTWTNKIIYLKADVATTVTLLIF